MATSLVDYQGQGFWERDSVLEGWLCLAVLELRRQSHPQPWELEMEQEWSFYASAGIMGAVDPRLDHFLADPERKPRLLALVEAVHHRLVQMGETVPAGELNALLPPGNQWEQNPRTEWFTVVGQRIRALVEGTLHTDAASRLDYL